MVSFLENVNFDMNDFLKSPPLGFMVMLLYLHLHRASPGLPQAFKHVIWLRP